MLDKMISSPASSFVFKIPYSIGRLAFFLELAFHIVHPRRFNSTLKNKTSNVDSYSHNDQFCGDFQGSEASSNKTE